jgi:hypothetical protein
VNNNTEPTSSTGGTHLPPPDYKQIRKYLRTIQQREALGQFIKAGWTPAELAEYARQMYLVPGQTKPTAASYQFVVEKGPEHLFAQEILGGMRAPGYVIPPFDRPVPKRYAYDDPDNPEHTPEVRADVAEIARLYRNRQASWLAMPRPDPTVAIPRWLWKRCYRLRNRYHSLTNTIEIQALSD